MSESKIFSRIVVVDVETTGLSARLGDRICEIGIVLIENGKISETFETLVNPQRPINSMASMIHGLQNKDVRHAPPFSHVLPRVLRMLEGAVFVAHNARFDHTFIEHEIRREHGHKFGFPATSICTMKLARKRFGYGNGSLDYVCQRLRVRNICPHHALPDALAEVDVLRKLAGSLHSGKVAAAIEEAGILTQLGMGRFPKAIGKPARGMTRNH